MSSVAGGRGAAEVTARIFTAGGVCVWGGEGQRLAEFDGGLSDCMRSGLVLSVHLLRYLGN